MSRMNLIGGLLRSYVLYFSFKFVRQLFLVTNLFFFVWQLQIITQFKEQGLNTELYYKNKEMGETFSIVPTSAIRFLNYLCILMKLL